MAKTNLTTTDQFSQVSIREIDFVSRFTRNWDALREILGIMRPIKKSPGTKLVSYQASVTLETDSVGEGEEIPYSIAGVTPVSYGDVTVEKYAKAVSIEAVEKYGAPIAVQKTDDQFLIELQNKVLSSFYTFLGTGTLVAGVDTWQAALATAHGDVLEHFAGMDRDITSVVGFANILDAYEYLATSDITVQTEFGINYIKNFMGYSTLILLPNKYIARGKVIATPVDNIDLYYIDPGDSDFAKLGLNYTVDGETNLIGFHAQGNYNTAVGEAFALMGMTLWAEYLSGIAVITIGTYTVVESPTGNPKTKGYYEKSGIQYVPTEDTTVTSGKTYYEKA